MKWKRIHGKKKNECVVEAQTMMEKEVNKVMQEVEKDQLVQGKNNDRNNLEVLNLDEIVWKTVLHASTTGRVDEQYTNEVSRPAISTIVVVSPVQLI